MRRRRRRAGEAGFSLIDVAMSALVVTIAVAGLAVTVVFQRNLERSQDRLSKEAATAVSTVEDIHADSNGLWTGLQASWDNRTITPTSVGNASAATLTTTVSADAAALSTPDGMWTPGSTAPNFYFVNVHASSQGMEFGNALKFQTYLADHFNPNATTASIGSSIGVGTWAAGTTGATKLMPDVTNMLVTGLTLNTLTYNVTNGSTATLTMVSAKLTVGQVGTFTYFQVGDAVLYNNATAKHSVTYAIPVTYQHLAPGPLDIKVVGKPKPPAVLTALLGQAITVAITFSDSSVATYVVNP